MLSCLLLIATLRNAAPQEMQTGEDVVRAMHDRYAGRWYENLARSDIAPLDAGNCIMCKR